MGLLSKLFGDAKTEQKVVGALKDLVNQVKEKEKEFGKDDIKPQSTGANAQAAPAAVAGHTGYVVSSGAPKVDPETAPFGVSWGEEMPAEENQYNYPGNFVSYFEKLYQVEFPEYRLEKTTPGYGSPAVVFTFWQGEKKALVVEVISRKSDVYKLRKDCRAAGTPYLRYYHDAEGWWNTRAYVTNRTRAALEGKI